MWYGNYPLAKKKRTKQNHDKDGNERKQKVIKRETCKNLKKKIVSRTIHEDMYGLMQYVMFPQCKRYYLYSFFDQKYIN